MVRLAPGGGVVELIEAVFHVLYEVVFELVFQGLEGVYSWVTTNNGGQRGGW